MKYWRKNISMKPDLEFRFDFFYESKQTFLRKELSKNFQIFKTLLDFILPDKFNISKWIHSRIWKIWIRWTIERSKWDMLEPINLGTTRLVFERFLVLWFLFSNKMLQKSCIKIHFYYFQRPIESHAWSSEALKSIFKNLDLRSVKYIRNYSNSKNRGVFKIANSWLFITVNFIKIGRFSAIS